LSFLVDAGWEIARLPKLDDGVTSRNGFDEAGRFLTARVERYIIELGHGRIVEGVRRVSELAAKSI
jgi:hypothetical protein